MRCTIEKDSSTEYVEETHQKKMQHFYCRYVKEVPFFYGSCKERLPFLSKWYKKG